jgi:hypothetical protein
MKNKIEKDIWEWITNFLEVNHEFYHYKFTPCPYAKSARLKGLVNVTAYTVGSKIGFIEQQTEQFLADKQYNVQIFVFPSYLRWFFHVRWKIHQLNKKLIPNNYYAQYGWARPTKSQYPGLFNSSPYFIVIINKLSDVLSGHKSLLDTDYYSQWSKSHYNNVVERRNNMVKKYKKDQL